MGLSALHVGELVQEIDLLLRGAVVRGVQPLPPRDLLLALTPEDPAHGALLRLRVSADAEAARLHLQIGPVKRHEGATAPFFRQLEEGLAGARVHGIEQVQDDRVVRFLFRRDGSPCAQLIAELTGRHANLLLLDGGGRLQACLAPPAAGSPAALRLTPGVAYSRPPGRQTIAPTAPLAESFPESGDGGPTAALAPLSARVEQALGTTAEVRFEEEQRRELTRRLERRVQSAKALHEGLRRRQLACDEAERMRMDGELLLAHLATIERGVSEVELPDSHQADSPMRRIPLDPGLSARRNAEKLFARYRKLRRTLERLPEELERAEEGLRRAEEWLARAAAEEPGRLECEALEAGILTRPQEKPGRAKPVARLPYLRFRALRGSEIRVGRNARDNDQLTFRESRGNDLWLHTADAPGSHVVLRLERGAEPDEEEILDAAHLAVHFSPLRGSPRTDVHIARRKQVHKPRKAPPGLVTVSAGRVLRLRVEPARLERLLETRPPLSGPGPGADHR